MNIWKIMYFRTAEKDMNLWLILAVICTTCYLFSRKKRLFPYFFLLLVPVQCLDGTFLYLIFAQWHKILSLFWKLSAILKHRRKNFVLMTSVLRLSSTIMGENQSKSDNNLGYYTTYIRQMDGQNWMAEMLANTLC